MKKAITIVIVAIAFLSSSGPSDKGSWIIDGKSQLTIHGSTNINDFACKIDCYAGSDTLNFTKNYTAREIRFSRNRMTIPIGSFDCGPKQISKDFRKTLKSDIYPELHINFRSLQNLVLANNSCINGVVDVTLAGVTARYTIRYDVSLSKNIMLLNGTQSVNFSDFNLVAPEKLRGLIKVKEALKVEFNLVLKEI